MAHRKKTLEDLDIKVTEYAQIAVEEAYLRHFEAGRAIVLSKGGLLIRRQLGTKDVVLKELPPRRKVSRLTPKSA